MGFFDKVGGAIGGLLGGAGGAITGGILGGDAVKGLGKGAEKQTVMNVPWNAEELKWLQDQAKETYEAGPQQYFPGSTIADLDPRVQQTLNQMMGFGTAGLSGQGGDALTQALTGIRQQAGAGGNAGDYASYLMRQAQQPGGSNTGQVAAQVDPSGAINDMLGAPGQNPYIDSLVQQVTNDLSRNLNENIMPRIDQASTMNNAYGGSRQGIAQGKAIEGTQRQASDAATQIRSTAYENDSNRRLSAADLASRILNQGDSRDYLQQQLGLQGAQLSRGLTGDLAQIAPLLQAYEGSNLATQMQGGQAYQQYLQSLLNEDVNRFNFEQNADWQNIGKYADVLLGSGSLGSETSQNTPEAGLLERILGGGATGAGMYGLLSSAAVPGAGWIAGGAGLLSALAG